MAETALPVQWLNFPALTETMTHTLPSVSTVVTRAFPSLALLSGRDLVPVALTLNLPTLLTQELAVLPFMASVVVAAGLVLSAAHLDLARPAMSGTHSAFKSAARGFISFLVNIDTCHLPFLRRKF